MNRTDDPPPGPADAPVLIALGANLPGPHGPPRATLAWACTRLAAMPGLALAATSRWYASPAWPPGSGQPDYVNGVVSLAGTAEPGALLTMLHAIEAEAGRVRGQPNAARPLDLDLLAVGSQVQDGPGPVLPHPRLQDRAFVLRPLCDVAPGWVHPTLHRTARALLAALHDADAAIPLP